jgi:hypothetical protein
MNAGTGLAARTALVLLALAGAAATRAQTPDATCRNGSFPTDETSIGQAQVIGQGRLWLLNDDNGCPTAAAKCRGPTSVRTGATLLSGHRLGTYVCAFDPVSGDAGYVDTARLKPLPVDASPPLKAWVGRWREGDDVIRLTAKGAALTADGQAWWPSAHPSTRQFPGGPNTGDLSGTATPRGAVVIFADDASDPQACKATLRLVGADLVVADNGACGGMNVSFTGVYRR